MGTSEDHDGFLVFLLVHQFSGASAIHAKLAPAGSINVDADPICGLAPLLIGFHPLSVRPVIYVLPFVSFVSPSAFNK